MTTAAFGGGRRRDDDPTVQRGPSRDIQRQLERLRNPGAGTDIFGLASPQGVASYQEPLPPLDFRWTWSDGRQQGFAYTVNSERGGLNMQRGRIELAHDRQANSSLVSHAKDQVILPFATETQNDEQTGFMYYRMLHTNFQEREVMAPYFGSGSVKVFAEDSAFDATVSEITNLQGPIFSMGVVAFEGRHFLCIATGATFYAYLTLGGIPFTISSWKVTESGTADEPSYESGFTLVSATGGSQGSTSGAFGGFISTPWGGGQSTTAYKAHAFEQSPLPGNPLIIRSQNSVLLAGTDDFDGNASLMLKNVGLGISHSMGFLSLGPRPLRSFWHEQNLQSVVAANYRSRIASVNAYGTDYQVLSTSTTRIIGACGIPQRGAVGYTDGRRVLVHNGVEVDTGIFSGESANPTFSLFCVGLYTLDGDLFAEVNELPKYTGNIGFGVGISQGRIRRCVRRYDFDLGRWHQVSEWTVLAESGLIRWNTGIPIPVASGDDRGYMSAYGAPDLPFGKVTRAIHNHAVPAYYESDLTATVAPPTEQLLTWHHKFEPHAATDPYSLRDGDKSFASEGAADGAALLFPPGTEYFNKYIDAIEWGGQDTGGAGSKVNIYVGEGGRLDETAPGPFKATFNHELTHASRRVTNPANQTALLFPQVRVEIERGSSTNKTMQALPFTIYGHIDMEERKRESWMSRWLPFGRSKG